VRKLKTSILVLISTAGIFYSCSNGPSQRTEAASTSSAARKPAPDFTLKDSNGAQVKLSDYRGKVVLLNFWATWCGPCKIEIPWFIDFQQQYKDKGFEVLGVAMDDDGWTAVKPYIAERKVNYRVLLGDDSVATLFGGIDSLPTTFVIDRSGAIDKVHVGLIGKDDYLKEIQGLLAENKVTNSRRAPRTIPALFAIGSDR
jgi:peroxiredoxin